MPLGGAELLECRLLPTAPGQVKIPDPRIVASLTIEIGRIYHGVLEALRQHRGAFDSVEPGPNDFLEFPLVDRPIELEP